MRDALLNDLINTLERHGCEIKISIPTTRGRAERSKTDSDLRSTYCYSARRLRHDSGQDRRAPDGETWMLDFRGIHSYLDRGSGPSKGRI